MRLCGCITENVQILQKTWMCRFIKLLFKSVLRRSCWHAVRKVKVRSRTAWKWCSASQRKPTTPCTCQCWRVRPREAQTHLHTPTQLNALFLPPAGDALGFDGNIDSQGELILQESFQVWDPKTLIRKGRDRHLFLFEMSLVFSKDVKDSNGRSKYLYKSKLFVRDQAIISLLCLSITAKKKWALRRQHTSDELKSALWWRLNAFFWHQLDPVYFFFLLDIRTWSDRTRGGRSL